MQDKEILEQGKSEEGSTPTSETKHIDANENLKERRISLDDEDEDQLQKSQTKDGKFTFRKMKQPKKEKADKKKALRYKGEGVSFKAKLIGVEPVQQARGDKMCQDAMQVLKMNVKNLGPHKRKIHVCVSLQGIKIKDEKTGEVLHHHPVANISFISQHITDARAFGYVAGCKDGGHQFIGIKTEKPAFHVVVALRDLFQAVLSLKQEKMEKVKEKKIEEMDTNSSIGSNSLSEKLSFHDRSTDGASEEEEKSNKEENIYFDVILTEPLTVKEPDTSYHVADDVKESVKTVDDLLGLQDELNKLQEGIEQMDTSIAAAFGTNPVIEPDPFDTSFVNPTSSKIDARFPQNFPLTVLPSAQPLPTGDKYAVFSDVSSEPSIFESAFTKVDEVGFPDLNELEEEIKKKFPAPAKPPRNTKTAAADLSVFADLDPLGKDRPYKDKAEFFQDVKNPPKKVLNDLVDKPEDLMTRAFDVATPPVQNNFPVSTTTAPTSALGYSSSLPNSFLSSHLNFSVAYPQNPFNPFDKESSASNYFGQSSASEGTYIALQNSTSSPIPIPTGRPSPDGQKTRTSSNGSLGSPTSKSPLETTPPFQNGISPKQGTVTNGVATNGGHKITNGVSRPRPRSTLSKISPLQSNGIIANYHKSSNGTTQRDNVVLHQSNGVKDCGQRTRAITFPVDMQRDCRMSNSDIFGKKADPFGDEFFRSLPKGMPNHLTKTEIQDYV